VTVQLSRCDYETLNSRRTAEAALSSLRELLAEAGTSEGCICLENTLAKINGLLKKNPFTDRL
jgi:hypothetical protein